MKRILFSLILLPAVLCGLSAAYRSPMLKARLARCENVVSRSMEDSPEFLPVIMRLSSLESIVELEQMGVIIWHTRENLALGAVPMQIIPDVVSSRWVSEITTSVSSLPSMRDAAVSVGLDKVRQQIDLNGDFTGEGVVVGFSDIGFDPSHINFLNDDGSPRTVKLTHYDGFKGVRSVCETQEEIQGWTSDNIDKYHATHVCGILAGSAPGSPYNGVAQKAEIVSTTSNLYDPEILAGIEDVIMYAKAVGSPAVVNLSLSSMMGPHDGTQLFNEYIDKLGREAIITVSAGNSGSAPMVISKRLTDGDSKVGTGFMDAATWTGFKVNGAFDLWSDNSEPLKTQLLILDDLSYSITHAIDVDGDELIMVSHELAADYPQGVVDPEFDRLFEGIVIAYRELNPLNGRYNVYVEMDFKPRKQQTKRGWAESWVGLLVEGTPGTRIDGYSSENIHLSSKSPELLNGTGEGSINDIATARNVISVGAYNTCNSFHQLNGEPLDFPKYPLDEASYFSSFGTLVDGRKLPLVSAPGAMVVSSVPTHYIANGGRFSPLVYSQTHGGRTYYWGAEEGTSMSAPIVAGGIALWLQADPSLTVDDVKEIISETSPLPAEATDPRWGLSKFNLYAGLKKVLGDSGIDNVVEPLKPTVTRDGDLLTITTCDQSPITCTLTSASGIDVFTARISNTVTLSISHLPKGLYLLRIHNSTSPLATLKILR